MAGLLPGILLTVLFSLTIVIWTTLRPELGPKADHAAGFRERLASLAGLIETLILFVLVMGGLFVGFFTPTEAGAVGAFGTLVIALIRRNLTVEAIITSLFETTRISCMIMNRYTEERDERIRLRVVAWYSRLPVRNER